MNKEKIAFIENKLSEYNSAVGMLQKGTKVPYVYSDFNSEIGLIGFYVKEKNDESGLFIDTRYIFIAKNYDEAISFIRGIRLVISYLSF